MLLLHYSHGRKSEDNDILANWYGSLLQTPHIILDVAARFVLIKLVICNFSSVSEAVSSVMDEQA